MVDEIVKRAMVKWPNAPALFGWLRLDRRGHWYLRGERVELEPLKDFIERNYEGDEYGRWYFQNGPQRVFIELEYTPWILFSQPDGSLETHTGEPVSTIEQAYLDERGRMLLVFERGPALLAEGDLDWALEHLRDGVGAEPAEDALSAALEALQRGDAVDLALEYRGHTAPIAALTSGDAPARLSFERQPAPLPEEENGRK